jgi:predicted nucleotidyltransferase component of viral defense system
LESDIKIEIYNNSGNIMHVEKNANRISEIDVSNYPTGIYTVNAVYNEKIFSEKFTKL